jgi:endonuclease/exonuclease/phosphatase family metal-dependent hydrolase
VNVVMSERGGSDRGGACREDPTRQILKQDVGFAIRKSVRFTRNADLQALGLGDPDLRWGVDVTLDLRRPLRLLSIHLKSGCNAGRAPADPDCPVLFRQAEVLERWVDARARAGEDFALLGDWNRRTGLAGDAFLASLSDHEPPGGRLVLTDAGTSARCVARYRDFIDHITLGVRAATRLVPGSFAEYHYGGLEESHPSDHCPVSVAVRPR